MISVLLVVFCSLGCKRDPVDPPGLDLGRRLSAGEVVAGVLDEAGPFIDHDNRTARAGDVLLKNSRVWFVVEGIGPSDWYIPFGGGLLDADLVREDGEPGYDGIDEWHPVVGLSPMELESIEILNDGTNGEPAHVRVVGREGILPIIGSALGIDPSPVGIDIEVDYILEPDTNALEIVTRVYNESSGTLELETGDFALLGDDEAEPWSIPGGFDRSALSATPVALGSSSEVRRWALAIYGDGAPLSILGGGAIASLLGGGDTTLFMYTTGVTRIRPGEVLEARRYLAIGRDIADALDERLLRSRSPSGVVSGTVTAGGQAVSGARITFLDADRPDSFAGQAISAADGTYSARLAPGTYEAVVTAEGIGEEAKVEGRLRTLADGHPPATPVALTVTAEGETSVDLQLPLAGRVRIVVTDANGDPLPSKIIFQHEDAPPPGRRVLGERTPYPSLGVRKVMWTTDGQIEASIRPGTYTVTAGCGFAYEIDVQVGVVVVGGQTTDLVFALAQPVDLSGYVVMDAHLHAAPSVHGEVSMAERLVTAIAEGLEVHVASEHDRVIDFRPLVQALGLRPQLLSIVSDEMSTIATGHHNAWPLEPDPTLINGGAPLWWNDLSIEEVYSQARALGAQVIQVNHGEGSGGYFDAAGFDLATGTIARPDLFSWDFDSMELQNGKGDGGKEELLPIWYTLLNTGRRIAPTAVSDSHARIPEAGTGRAYILTGNDDIGTVSTQDIVDAVLGMRTVPSTGLFIRFTAAGGSATIGDDIGVDTAGAARLEFEVWGPQWMDVATVQLIGNGQVIDTWDATTTPAVSPPANPSRAVWFSHAVDVTPGQDTWYVVRADGIGDLAPMYPNVRPWAVTSPIFVDADGNGTFDPPL